MSHFIVLIKQVPDVTQITDNAFNPETGTLVRTRLPSVINELDTQALALANYMRNLQAPTNQRGRIVCVTMGPPMAEEVLRYALGRCADAAVLLTDRALAGADTWATANPLAFAIRKIVREFFGAGQDYYILCGMQSVDGDTAQVPPQIAEELDIPCVTYVTAVELVDDRFRFTRIISGGNQVVVPCRLPAVITVAKYEYPLFATFAATRQARQFQLVQWSAADIGATTIGVAGSKTRVIRVFPPGESSRRCRQLNDAGQLAAVLLESLAAEPQDNRRAEGCGYILPELRTGRFDRSCEATAKEAEDYRLLTEKLEELGVSDVSHIDEALQQKILAAVGEQFHKKALEDMLAGFRATRPAYSGDVWVVAELQDGGIHPATLELVGKARELADCLRAKVAVVVAGNQVSHLGEELIAAGADEVYVIEDALLAAAEPGLHRKAVADVIRKYAPQIVLFGATPWGRVLAPMISYRLGCGLTADCTGLDIKDSSRKGQVAILMQTRPALGGNVMATICTKDCPTQMATARPGVMKKLQPDSGRRGKVITHQVPLSPQDVSLDILSTELAGQQVDLGAAQIIVSGGKGLQNRDNYEKLTGALCQALSERLGAKVQRGASRAAVEQGFVKRAHQVGQTGTSVAPKIYLALGISGAIQHMIGIANSQTIIAINSDPAAPILRQCDCYLLAKVENAVPQLLEKLKE
jgi:electron transfer flavoprotein alpha subunit